MQKIKFNQNLLFNLLFPLLSSFVISMSLPSFSTFYNNLNTLIRVPPILFPIVWTILYLLMGYLGYQLSILGDSKLEKIYYIQLLVNLIWAPVFFGLKNIAIALIVIILLLGILIYFFYELFKKNKKLSYLLIPYIAWVTFATFLNLSILILN